MKQGSEAKMRYSCKIGDVKLARGHTFVRAPSLCSMIVIDGGAHRCEFAGIMATTYGARVIALEPNTALPVERRHRDIVLLSAALSSADGEGAFFLNKNPEGSSIVNDGSAEFKITEAVPVTLRSLKSLVTDFQIDQIGLLKLDIEGAEFGVIRSIDEELAHMIHQITVEFHPADPRGEEVIRMQDAIAHLEALGFHMCCASFRGFGDVLFLNSRYFAQPSLMFRVFLPYIRKALERGGVAK